MSEKYGLALDIGYSSLKARFGYVGGETRKLVRPAGAYPYQCSPSARAGIPDPCGFDVLVRGEHWVAAVEPDRARNWCRNLTADYHKTDQFRANLHAALSWMGRDSVDVLHISAPMEHWLNETLRAELQGRVQGTHQISSSRRVQVHSVRVLPSAGCSHFKLLEDYGEEGDSRECRLIKHGTALIVDAGFYGVDWAIMDSTGIDHGFSGTSRFGMSVVCEDVTAQIEYDAGENPGREMLERALAYGRDRLTVAGSNLKIGPYIEKAMKYTGETAVTEIRNALRLLPRDGIDFVSVVGGYADLYRRLLADSYPDLTFLEVADTVTAGVDGLWQTIKASH